MSIDYAQLAQEAGLDPGEVYGFVRGARGDRMGELNLKRSCYDRLQCLVEQAEGEAPMADGEVFRLCYLTKALLTPFYRTDHPRFPVVEKLFDTRGGKCPPACAVATIRGFNEQKAELDPEQRVLLEARLRDNIPSEGLPSICLTRMDWGYGASVSLPAVNYLALPATQDRPAMAFHANQGGPQGLAKSWGSVLFGEKAQRLAEKALREWRENAQPWGSHKILRLLNGD